VIDRIVFSHLSQCLYAWPTSPCRRLSRPSSIAFNCQHNSYAPGSPQVQSRAAKCRRTTARRTQSSTRPKVPKPTAALAAVFSGYAERFPRPWPISECPRSALQTTDPEATWPLNPGQAPNSIAHRFRHRIDVEVVDDRFIVGPAAAAMGCLCFLPRPRTRYEAPDRLLNLSERSPRPAPAACRRRPSKSVSARSCVRPRPVDGDVSIMAPSADAWDLRRR